MNKYFIDDKAPELTTTQATDITATTAKASGNITYAGTPEYTERGVCYGTTENPTVNNTKIKDDGTGMGGFTVNLTGLTAETTYYVRAYSTNTAGTSYGNEVSFTTDAAIMNTTEYQPSNFGKTVLNRILPLTITDRQAHVQFL